MLLLLCQLLLLLLKHGGLRGLGPGQPCPMMGPEAVPETVGPWSTGIKSTVLRALGAAKRKAGDRTGPG